jgi:predicted transcriptional regulator
LNTPACGKTSLEWIEKGVVLSIAPKWEAHLAAGTKRLEFRRRWPRLETPYYAAVYASAPVSAVVGLATVGAVHVGEPASLAELAVQSGGPDSRGELERYFQGAIRGAALEISCYLRLVVPIDLATLRTLGVSQPPQSYAYLASFPHLQERLREGRELAEAGLVL